MGFLSLSYAICFFQIKTALEKKLKLERKQHEQKERDLQRQTQTQNELKERSVQEANQKLTSLQQHYKLLKSQLEDFKDECSKLKSAQLSKINSLESQIKELHKGKDDDANQWKVLTVISVL